MVWVVAAAVTMAVVSGGCVPNLAAPARTPDGYSAAVKKTAGTANGSVGTAKLVCEAAVGDRAFFPYLSVTVSDAEDQLGSVITTFASIEPPPDPASDELRRTTTELLNRSSDDVSAARIAIRRGDVRGLGIVCDALARDADELRKASQ